MIDLGIAQALSLVISNSSVYMIYVLGWLVFMLLSTWENPFKVVGEELMKKFK